MDNLFAYLAVAAVLVASPGPDSILILKNTLVSGRLTGGSTVAGVQVGVGTHALLSAAGLSALLYYSPEVFRALALLGALYLAYLGYLTMAHGIRGTSTGTTSVSPRRAFMQGMLCNLLNPKVIILFVAVIPGFVEVGASSATQQILLLALLLLAINIPFQICLVLIAAKVDALLNTPRAARLVQGGLGAVLMLFAVALFAEHVLTYTR